MKIKANLLFLMICFLFITILQFQIVFAIPPAPTHPCWKQNNCPIDPDSIAQKNNLSQNTKRVNSQFSLRFSQNIPSTTTIGNQKIIVIPVRFSDVENSTTLDQINSTIQQIRNYYQENSFYQLNFTIELRPNWYDLDNSMSYYGADNTSCTEYRDFGHYASWGCEFAGYGSLELIWSALSVSDSDVDFSKYDHIFIIHTGRDEASSGSSDDIWSVHPQFSPGFSFDGVAIQGAVISSEFSPLGTFVHELAHDLGAPDLYNTNTSNSVVGGWDLLDYGSWLGDLPGSNPSHLSAWNKILLEWISPTTIGINMSYNFTILPLESITSGTKIIKVPILSDSSQEYFLIENRQKNVANYDASIPESGIVIWHVDDMQSNNNGLIKKVIPVNQNPNFDCGVIPLCDAAYTVGDQDFTPSTNPNSSKNDGSVSGIYIGRWNKLENSYYVLINNSDTSPPRIVISSPSNTTYNTSTVLLNVSVDENAKWIKVSLNSGLNSTFYNTGFVTYNLTSLSDGSHKIELYASDYADNANNTNVIFTVDTCISNWTLINSSCEPNDKKLIIYNDTNKCKKAQGLPTDNGTYVSCDYCTPQWALNNTWNSCQISDLKFKNYHDSNNCNETENKPNDLNQTCDYCIPSWKETNTTCQPNDKIIGYFTDENGCYNKTGLIADLENKSENITYSCDYCTPSWALNNTWNSCQAGNVQYKIYYDINSCNEMETQPNSLSQKCYYVPPKHISNNTVNITENQTSIIDLKNETNLTLEILTIDNVTDSSINVTLYSENPGASNYALTALGKYVEIDVSSELKNVSSWAIIKIHYTDEELSTAGLDENTLRIEYYNETSGTWTTYDPPNGGVNTTENYVWANTTHFSIFGVYGSAPIPTTTTTTVPPSDGGGGGGGGGGGPQPRPCELNGICDSWETPENCPSDCKVTTTTTTTTTTQPTTTTTTTTPTTTTTTTVPQTVAPNLLSGFIVFVGSPTGIGVILSMIIILVIALLMYWKKLFIFKPKNYSRNQGI